MSELQNILNQFFGVSVRPVQKERYKDSYTKRVEYWIHRGQDADDTAHNGIDILYGREWRKGRAIAADPPDDVFLVERVLVWDNGRQEYETLFERS
jgi:diketogulonate reductase-like aldo/keto reductase